MRRSCGGTSSRAPSRPSSCTSRCASARRSSPRRACRSSACARLTNAAKARLASSYGIRSRSTQNPSAALTGFLFPAREVIMSNDSNRGFTTSILHSDRDAAIEHGALHKPLHLSVAYGYRDARELAAVFQGRAQGYAYGRQGNPTTAALEEKINRMEDGVATACFGTGMAA